MTDTHILAADIGGTSSRFGWFTARKGILDCVHRVRFATKETDSLPCLLTRALTRQPERKVHLMVLAVAGAVQDGIYAEPPNIPWTMDLCTIPPHFPPTLLLNDFVAQAYACRTQIMTRARIVKKGVCRAGSPLAVVGAGTGLGHCALIPDGHGGEVALPSEAGHTPFAFCGKEELCYQAWITRKTGRERVIAEDVVSGPGLSLLHEFLTGELLTPQEVAAAFTSSSSTLAWFARFYGRVCRSYSLTLLACAGLYITGGLAIKNPCIIRHPAFIEEFLAAPGYAYILDDIPVLLNTEEEAGLWGAAEYGRRQR